MEKVIKKNDKKILLLSFIISIIIISICTFINIKWDKHIRADYKNIYTKAFINDSMNKGYITQNDYYVYNNVMKGLGYPNFKVEVKNLRGDIVPYFIDTNIIDCTVNVEFN